MTNKQKIKTNTSPLEAAKTEPYLRDRPFLVINIIHRPAKTVKTEVKGWKDIEGNIENFEVPSVVDRVNKTQMIGAAIIVDVLRAECVKNQFTGSPPDEVAKYYISKYQAQITEATEIWLSNKVRSQAALKNKKSSVDATYSIA